LPIFLGAHPNHLCSQAKDHYATALVARPWHSSRNAKRLGSVTVICLALAG
jgi:hypothetical protein